MSVSLSFDRTLRLRLWRMGGAVRAEDISRIANRTIPGAVFALAYDSLVILEDDIALHQVDPTALGAVDSRIQDLWRRLGQTRRIRNAVLCPKDLVATVSRLHAEVAEAGPDSLREVRVMHEIAAVEDWLERDLGSLRLPAYARGDDSPAAVG